MNRTLGVSFVGNSVRVTGFGLGRWSSQPAGRPRRMQASEAEWQQVLSYLTIRSA
jgi:hypothetical protein